MINKLIANIKKTNAPIVVGLDPMLNYVPEHVQKKAFAEYGETLEGAAEAVLQFNKAIVDATYAAIPGTPNCSYMATCGFTAGIRSYVASTIALLNCQTASAGGKQILRRIP